MDFFRNENLWLYLPLILLVCGIFYLSSDKGSTSNTSRFINPIFNFLFPDAAPEKLNTFHYLFRKISHFVVYATVSLFASIPYYNSTVMLLANFWYLFAFVTVLTVASTDEIKQSFYSNRIGSVSDVVLDSAGGLTMIFLFWLFTATLF